jgi:hypothetical protein
MLLLGNPRVVSQMPMFFVAYTFLVVMVVELLLLTAVVAAKQGPFVCFSTLDAAFFSHVDLDVTPGAPTSSIVTAMLVFSVLQHTGPIPDKPRQGCCSQKATKTTTTFILQHTSSAAKTRQKKKAMENQGERWHLSSNPHHHHHHQYMWACGITKIGSCRSWVPMHMYAAGGWFGRLSRRRGHGMDGTKTDATMHARGRATRFIRLRHLCAGQGGKSGTRGHRWLKGGILFVKGLEQAIVA